MKISPTYIILIFGLSAFIHTSWAQCDVPPAADNCIDAPILCNFDEIDGYCLKMDKTITGNGPSPICAQGGAPHNTHWFAFYAGCTSLTITLTPTNCVPVGGQLGIQAAIYGYGGNGLCPDSPQQPAVEIACQSIPCFDTPWTLLANGMTIGQIYYFMIDGCAGSYCDISIDLLTPCGAPAIDNWPGSIEGTTSVCAGSESRYTIPAPTGGIDFSWYINDILIQSGTSRSFEYIWTKPGVYELCVDVSNHCVPESDDPKPSCIQVEVIPTEREGRKRYVCRNGYDSWQGVNWTCADEGIQRIEYKQQEYPYCDSILSFEIVCISPEVVIAPSGPFIPGDTLMLDGSGSHPGPAGATVTWQWTAQGGGVLTGATDGQQAVALTPGEYCLEITASSPNGAVSCSDMGCITINALGESAEFRSSEEQSIMWVYPVPATGQLWIRFGSEADSEGIMKFYNYEGRLIHQTTKPQGIHQQNIDLANWPAGVYTIVLESQTGEQIASRRVVVK